MSKQVKTNASQHIYFTPELINRLDLYVAKHYGLLSGRGRSAVVRQAVEEYLDRKGEPKNEPEHSNR